MNKALFTVFFWVGWGIVPSPSFAQEKEKMNVEQSADVYLEEYSDEFQESFFEALKQKGIENYDKAIHLLLKCKQLQPNTMVVNYELAKAYLADGQPTLAQEYAIASVVGEPENLWYLQTLVTVCLQQHSFVEQIKTSIPYDNNQLRENLAYLYYQQGYFKKSRHILKSVQSTDFTKELGLKVEDSIKKQSAMQTSTPYTVTDNNTETTNAMTMYMDRMKAMIRAHQTDSLQQLASEALESYPSQPYFYYVNGLALNRKGKYREAIEILESGLDYLIDDISLANKIYQELGDAYNAMGNTPKANTYLRKIKSGF